CIFIVAAFSVSKSPSVNFAPNLEAYTLNAISIENVPANIYCKRDELILVSGIIGGFSVGVVVGNIHLSIHSFEPTHAFNVHKPSLHECPVGHCALLFPGPHGSPQTTVSANEHKSDSQSSGLVAQVLSTHVSLLHE